MPSVIPGETVKTLRPADKPENISERGTERERASERETQRERETEQLKHINGAHRFTQAKLENAPPERVIRTAAVEREGDNSNDFHLKMADASSETRTWHATRVPNRSTVATGLWSYAVPLRSLS